MKQQVYVQDELVEIDVYQRSKTVWIAFGEYRGKKHEVTRSSPATAARAWANAAKYHSDPTAG